MCLIKAALIKNSVGLENGTELLLKLRVALMKLKGRYLKIRCLKIKTNGKLLRRFTRKPDITKERSSQLEALRK